MLYRHHNHLKMPFRNSVITRQRLFPTGAMTAMILGACFCSGYFYSRLK